MTVHEDAERSDKGSRRLLLAVAVLIVAGLISWNFNVVSGLSLKVAEHDTRITAMEGWFKDKSAEDRAFQAEQRARVDNVLVVLNDVKFQIARVLPRK